MRAKGFGEEAKRRILLGTYILSSANYESYYLKALQAQKQLKSDFEDLFNNYDAVLTPTSPEVARKI
jgi:glutamyl-tRNA(gln) amidotransferase subunit A 1